MVNPEIIERSSEDILWRETCLSLPELSVEIRRHKRVRVHWKTPFGEDREETFEDYEAVIIQHELDHLEGVVLLARVSRLKKSRWLKQQKKRQLQSSLVG